MGNKKDLDELIPGTKANKDADRSRRLISQIQDYEGTDYGIEEELEAPSLMSSFLPSSMLSNSNGVSKVKKEPTNNDNNEYTDDDADEWFASLIAYQEPSVEKRRRGNPKSLFVSAGIEKKKKKKKNKQGNLINFKQEFEPEMMLYKNLLVEQNRFTESLQKQYDFMKSTKSSSRGVTKQMTDLIENITDARSLAMQLVEKNVNAKKLIAELSMKQRKEFGTGEEGGAGANEFAAQYMRRLLNQRQEILNGSGSSEIIDVDDADSLIDDINASLQLSMESGELEERPDEVNKYLEYENQNVTVYVVIQDDDVDGYWFEAWNEEGELLDDYPLPLHTKMSINRSTNIATDNEFGQKYPVKWVTG